MAMKFGIDQIRESCREKQVKLKNLRGRVLISKSRIRVLYIPSRLHKSDVIVRYLEWWKQSVHDGKDGSGSLKCLDIMGSSFKGKNLYHYPLYPPGFNPKCQHIEVLDFDEEDDLTLKEFFIHNNKLKIVDHRIDERSNKTQELMWKSFDKQIKNTMLYIPSRLHKPDVTCKILRMVEESVYGRKDGSEV
ncbi:unnamed protein product [Dovyalis caffra]|uniref:Uncharacterized protein n=1 Tax=Dovyalis caffra TaxID=77055 RepID=A0AAV1R5K7_9ROSI|nr:unnamed protein product [Dovyalis caffra]